MSDQKITLMSAFLGRDKGQVPNVIAAAKAAAANVVCLQEVMDSELHHLDAAYRFVRFVPMTEFPDGRTMGLVTCTNLEVRAVNEQYYMGHATELPLFDESTPEMVNLTKRRPLLVCEVVLPDGSTHPVGNTHFLYTKDGTASEQHRAVLHDFMNVVRRAGPQMVLCAALVAPRDWSLYKELMLDDSFEDWVPRSITCTLDSELHKIAAKLKSGEVPPVVVDYIFGVQYPWGHGEVHQLRGVADHTPLVVQF